MTYENLNMDLKAKLRHKPICFIKLKYTKNSRKLKEPNTNSRTPNEHEFGWFKKIECN